MQHGNIIMATKADSKIKPVYSMQLQSTLINVRQGHAILLEDVKYGYKVYAHA